MGNTGGPHTHYSKLPLTSRETEYGSIMEDQGISCSSNKRSHSIPSPWMGQVLVSYQSKSVVTLLKSVEFLSNYIGVIGIWSLSCRCSPISRIWELGSHWTASAIGAVCSDHNSHKLGHKFPTILYSDPSVYQFYGLIWTLQTVC